ncbi:protein shisa-5-like [Pseudorasbora parva]|uniref:protein shisa-5-like n=1 Tax=Pseudorasbora parva TaxID=51549 RepID=UPI00351F76D4
MASSVSFLFLLLLGLFTLVGSEDCSMYGGKYEWCDSGKFCCGTCGDTYCCSDLQKKLQARLDCLLEKGFKNLGPPPQSDSVPVEVIVPIVVPILVTFIIVLITCWVCPCCCLYKRFRSSRPVIATTTVMATQYLPQPGVQGSRLPYQPLQNNPPYRGQPMPIGPFRGQPYQEAGPGYSVPFSQAPNDGGQAMYPIQPAQPTLPTDYTSPQPAYNPAYME